MNHPSKSKDKMARHAGFGLKTSDGLVKSFREVLEGNASGSPIEDLVESGSCLGV